MATSSYRVISGLFNLFAFVFAFVMDYGWRKAPIAY